MLFFIIIKKEKNMHIDESKKFDKRNFERNIKDGIINQKDYENYLSKLSDVSNKVFIRQEPLADSEDSQEMMDDEIQSKKGRLKKKIKGKGK